jgi:hypothetical protein
MRDLRRIWLSPAGEALPWKARGMYAEVEPDALPPVAAGDGSFSWLSPLPAGVEGMASSLWELEGEEAVHARLRALDQEARALGHRLPRELVAFMTSPSLFGRVPSCTGCYFDLEAEPAEDVVLPPSPGDPRSAFLVRFMTASQSAARWYLLLDGAEPARVAVGYLDFDDDHRLVEPMICEDSLEAFVRRFRIENLLWYHHDRGEPVEGELRAYLEEARRLAREGAR